MEVVNPGEALMPIRQFASEADQVYICLLPLMLGKEMSPITSSAFPGEVVPMPTLPLAGNVFCPFTTARRTSESESVENIFFIVVVVYWLVLNRL
jgi:hypothetical protein